MLEDSLKQVNELVGSLDPETGLPPKERLRDVKSATALWSRLREADLINNMNRAQEEAMFDGAPPFDQKELIADGQGHRTNLNYGEAESKLKAALGAFLDLINSVSQLIDTPLNRNLYPFSDQVYEWEQTIAEEFTRALRGWDKFTFNHLLCATYFTKFGVGIAYHEDENNWEWAVDSLANVFFPRRTFATESELEVVVATRSYQADQLYGMIRDPKSAETVGWNVEEVKKAICSSWGSQGTTPYNDWMRIEEDLKNNDIFAGIAHASEIRTLHLWVREFDGTVSHYISLQSGKNEQFLFKSLGRFCRMSEAMVTFTRGVGTNGHYHSIRGMGYETLPMIQISNLARGQMMDGAMMSSSLLVQSQDEDSNESLNFQYYGPYAVISPGVKVVPQSNPNFAQNIIPVLNDMTTMLEQKTGDYQSASALDPKEKTAFEVKKDVSAKAKLSTTDLDLFYEPWTRLLRGVLKRFCRRGYMRKDPGGEIVHDFLDRCKTRGVPLEAIYAVNAREAPIQRAVGAGSPEMRLLIFDEMEKLVPQMDDIGRANWNRDRAAARVGYERASRYFPAKTGSRIAPDMKTAELENNSMSGGFPVTVMPGEDHTAHIKMHFPLMAGLIQQLQQQPDSIAQVIPILGMLVQHTTEHVQAVSGSILMQSEAAQFRKILQNYAAVAENGALHLAKVQQQQAKEQGQAGGDQQSGNTALQVEIVRAQTKIQMMEQESQTKMAIAKAESQQKLAIQDAQAAAKIRSGQ